MTIQVNLTPMKVTRKNYLKIKMFFVSFPLSIAKIDSRIRNFCLVNLEGWSQKLFRELERITFEVN